MLQDWTFWFFVVCMTLGVGIIVYVRRYGDRRFREAAEKFANELGFREVSSDEVLPALQGEALELFKRGYRGRVADAWSGTYKGESLRIFTYSYSFGLPLIAHIRYSQTVVSLDWHGPDVPIFALAPKRDMDRGVGTLSWKKIDSKSAFFRRNWIMSPQPERVQRILRNGFEGFLAELPSDPGLSVGSSGRRLIVFRKRKLLAASHWPALIDEALAFANALRNASAQAAST